MTIDEIRQARREAEARICEELQRLEAATGMKYHSIAVSTMHEGTSFGGGQSVRKWERIVSATIELKLP